MKNKKIFFIKLFTIIIVAILYCFLNPRTTGSMSGFGISDIIDINSFEEIESSVLPDGVFTLNNSVGYYSTKTKKITHFYTLEDDKKLFANLTAYAIYSKYGTEIDLRSSRGESLKVIDSTGYPYFTSLFPTVFTIMSNGAGFSSYLITGQEVIREYKSNSFITSLSTNNFLHTSVSLLDGRALLLDKYSNVMIVSENSISDIQIAKAAVVSDTGKTFAVISGLNPEIITIYDVDSKSILYRKETGSENHYSPILICKDDYVYFEGNENFNVLHRENELKLNMPYKGSLLEANVSSKGYVALLSYDDVSYNLYIYSSKGVIKYFSKTFMPVSNIQFYDSENFAYLFDSYVLLLSNKVLL